MRVIHVIHNWDFLVGGGGEGYQHSRLDVKYWNYTLRVLKSTDCKIVKIYAYTAVQIQKAGSAYFTSGQILSFAFAEQYTWPFISRHRRKYTPLKRCNYLTLSSLNLPLSSSPTTSRELLSQFSTCSGWRWFEVGEKLNKMTMY